jgi:hypothetical protein
VDLSTVGTVKSQVRFQVFTAPNVKMTAVRDVAPCDLVDVDLIQRFLLPPSLIALR